MTIVDIDVNNSQSFPQMIAGDETVLVDFYAGWCGPCKEQAPILEELDGELGGKPLILKVDVESADELAAAYGILGVPTLCLMRDGQEIKRLTGLQSKKTLLGLMQ